MILKIITTPGGAVYYDELEKVRTEKIPFSGIANMQGIDCFWMSDVIEGDYEEALKNSMPIPIVLSIIAKRRKVNDYAYNEEITIATDKATYILNDEGKTIERIS